MGVKASVLYTRLPVATNLPSEAELLLVVQEAQRGSTDAFGQLYNHFFAPVYRYAAFRLPQEVAEDVTADIFVKVWEKLHTYVPKRNIPFAAWLFRIARHAVIDVYRRERGFEEVPEHVPDGDPLNRPEASIERKELLRIVRNALMQLPRRYRDILLLSYVSELQHREVAKVLHLTEGAVRILKLRALRKFEQFLPPEMRNRP
jgi:RNA polymerase sigma-70 factor (ECF subfamily)